MSEGHRAAASFHGQPNARPELQIDSAGGHGNFAKLAAVMPSDFNIELVQQPGNSPCFSVPDLAMWQAIQLGVEKVNGIDRQRELELVETVKKAWAALPDKKTLTGFEMRRAVATEALANAGWCDNEGKGDGGSKRVHMDALYAPLRALLGITS